MTTIICPEITGGSGGLADYTLRVVHEWPDDVAVRFLVPASAAPETPQAAGTEKIESRAESLLEKLPGRGGKVLLQYSAYGFDRVGYPRWLLRPLLQWKEKSGGLLVVMLHEIWTFRPLLNKNYLGQRLHRRDLGDLVRQADAVFTSTASQAQHLRALAPEKEVRVLPVGSNIRVREEVQPASRETGLAVLFGLQRSRISALRQMQRDLHALARQGLITHLIAVGAGNDASGDSEERKLLAELAFTRSFGQRGAMPEEQISAVLSAATFGISAQDELSLTKSGTFMAYAAHGLNILSPIADPVAEEPLCWLTSPAELLAGGAEDHLRSRAAALRAWQERTASWSRIAAEFAEALQLTGADANRVIAS